MRCLARSPLSHWHRSCQHLMFPCTPPPVPSDQGEDRPQPADDFTQQPASAPGRGTRVPASSPAPTPGPSRPLRVFKHGVDDLRLFKALEQAGMGGRVVVVDSLQGADVVLCTRRKASGKDVDVKRSRSAARSEDFTRLLAH